MATDVMDRAAQMFPQLTPAQIERIAARRRAPRRPRRARCCSSSASRTPASSWSSRAPSRSCGRSTIAKSRSSCTAPASSRARSTCCPRAAASSARARSATGRSSPSIASTCARSCSGTSSSARSSCAPSSCGGWRSSPTATAAWSSSARATRPARQHIREFLSRNAQPFTYQDVESDPDVQALLDRFHVGVDDVPVVVCRGRPRAAGTRRSRRWPRGSA